MTTGLAKEIARAKAKTINVLLVEDNEVDAQWVKRGLERFDQSQFQVDWVQTVSAAKEMLRAQSFDIVISDLQLPDSVGLETYQALQAAAPQVPFVLLTGTFEEQKMAEEAIHKGAQDYLFKGQATYEALIRSVVYALERQELVNMRDKFVNIVSHELRTPLAILSETVGQVYEGILGSGAEKQKEFLALALKSIERLNRTTTELLSLAKMEAGKAGLNKTRFDLGELVTEILSQFKGLARKKSLALKADFAPASKLEVTADRDKIARVLINFLNNALKFTQAGSIEVLLKDAGGALECSVRDTGIGIAAEDLPKVFDKFEQFGQKNKSSDQGSGLGLSIAKEIIILHGEKIWAESQTGKGSRFIFTLPKDPK